MLSPTNRLTYAELSMQDLHFVHALHSMPEVDEFNTLGIPASIEVTKDIITGWIEMQQQSIPSKYVWVIKSNTELQPIGLVGLNIGKPGYELGEIWYKLSPENWNKGYATEVVKGLLEFAFHTLKLHRIEAGCAVLNTASIKVLEKTGFKLEGRKRK